MRVIRIFSERLEKALIHSGREKPARELDRSAHSNRSGGAGDKAVEASGVEGRYATSRVCRQACRAQTPCREIFSIIDEMLRCAAKRH